MITKNFVALFSAALAAGCASGPTKEAMTNADYGSDMTSAQCVAAAEPVIANTLKDPGSAQFRHGACTPGHWKSIPLARMGVEFGWLQRGEVNGKNSFGGYVGFRPYQVLVKNGEAVRWCLEDEDGFCMPAGK